MGKPGAEAEKAQAAAPGKEEGQPPKPVEAKPAVKAEEAKPAKGAAQLAKGAAKEEPAATPKPTDWEKQYKELQKAHETTLGKVKELEGKASVGDTFLQRMDSLEKRLDMRDGEAVMQRVENLVDMGKPEAADELATRELSRRMAVLNLKPDDPLVAHLKAVPPRVALHQYLIQEPVLTQQAALKPKVEKPLIPDGAPAPVVEERIGGKTLAEIEAEVLKKAGVFKTLPDQPAGQTNLGFGPGVGTAKGFTEAVERLHAAQE
jgi:hypothetical protein